MIKIPLDEVKQKIIQQGNISEGDLQSKIQQKMDTLSGLISEEGAAHIIANELGLKIFDQPSGNLKVKDVLTGMRNVELAGKVQQIFDVRTFNTEKRSGKVGSFVLADETASIRIVLWNDQTDNMVKLSEGSVVKIVGGAARDNQMRKEIHMGDNSELVVNPPGVTIGEIKQKTNTRKTIKELQENEENIELLGTVVQVFDIRFFDVCPRCSRKAKPKEDKYSCDQHGEITPTHSYVLNVFLDDGTENIRAVFFRNQVERLLEKTPEEVSIFKTSPEAFEQVKHDLLGKIIKIVGRVKKNMMFDRLEFVTQLVFPNPDPKEEMKRVSESENKEKVDTTESVNDDSSSTEKIDAPQSEEIKTTTSSDDVTAPLGAATPNPEKPSPETFEEKQTSSESSENASSASLETTEPSETESSEQTTDRTPPLAEETPISLDDLPANEETKEKTL